MRAIHFRLFRILLTIIALCGNGVKGSADGPPPAAPARTVPVLGQPVPALNLPDVAGKNHSLSEYRGRPVALYFFCGCEFCRPCAYAWGQIQRSKALPPGATKAANTSAPSTLVVFMGDADAAREFAASTGLDAKQTILLTDPEDKAVLAYDALLCPRVFVLDGKGILRYTNNHKDDAPQKAPPAIIVDRAAAALRTASTPPPPIKASPAAAPIRPGATMGSPHPHRRSR